MKKFICVLLVVLQILFISACAVQKSDEPVMLTDMDGIEIVLPESIKKIICRSGNGTSFLVGMGLGDSLAGTADYVVTNPWAELFLPGISEMPTFGWSPSAEELYAVGADLVMLADGEVASSLRDVGINAICYKQYNEEELLGSVRLLGELFGDDAKAYGNKWLDYYQNTVDYLSDALSSIDGERPKVYYIYGQSNKGPGRTSGGGSIEELWIEQAGGIFTTSDLPNDGPTINEEEAISRNPDVILIGGIYNSVLTETLLSSPEWSEVSAVKCGKIFSIPIGFIPWDFYGVEYPLLLLWAAQQMYPDIIDIDMHSKTKEFYDEFYDITLSDEQITYMLAGLSPDGGNYIENP